MDLCRREEAFQLLDVHENVIGVENVETRSNSGLSVRIDPVLALWGKRSTAVKHADIVDARQFAERIEEESADVWRRVGNGHASRNHVNHIGESRSESSNEHVRF